MKTSTLAAVCAGLVVAWTVTAFAEIQLALPADGRAMIERAIAALKDDEASALKAFNDEFRHEQKRLRRATLGRF